MQLKTSPPDMDGICQRCTSPCTDCEFSCYPVSSDEILDRAKIDPVLCEECTAIFIMKFAPEDQYLVRWYEKNIIRSY